MRCREIEGDREMYLIFFGWSSDSDDKDLLLE